LCHGPESHQLTGSSCHHGRNVEGRDCRSPGQVSPEVSGHQGSPAGAAP
jgi:hypothetical protein